MSKLNITEFKKLEEFKKELIVLSDDDEKIVFFANDAKSKHLLEFDNVYIFSTTLKDYEINNIVLIEK